MVYSHGTMPLALLSFVHHSLIMYSRFSETNGSEFLINLKQILSRYCMHGDIGTVCMVILYCMHGDICRKFKSLAKLYYVSQITCLYLHYDNTYRIFIIIIYFQPVLLLLLLLYCIFSRVHLVQNVLNVTVLSGVTISHMITANNS